jgi:predicted small secreted protein
LSFGVPTGIIFNLHFNPKGLSMKTFLRSIAVVGVLALAAFATTGCNTVEGVGEDLSAGGDAISDTSRDVRD